MLIKSRKIDDQIDELLMNYENILFVDDSLSTNIEKMLFFLLKTRISPEPELSNDYEEIKRILFLLKSEIESGSFRVGENFCTTLQIGYCLKMLSNRVKSLERFTETYNLLIIEFLQENIEKKEWKDDNLLEAVNYLLLYENKYYDITSEIISRFIYKLRKVNKVRTTTIVTLLDVLLNFESIYCSDKYKRDIIYFANQLYINRVTFYNRSFWDRHLNNLLECEQITIDRFNGIKQGSLYILLILKRVYRLNHSKAALLDSLILNQIRMPLTELNLIGNGLKDGLSGYLVNIDKYYKATEDLFVAKKRNKLLHLLVDTEIENAKNISNKEYINMNNQIISVLVALVFIQNNTQFD